MQTRKRFRLAPAYRSRQLKPFGSSSPDKRHRASVVSKVSSRGHEPTFSIKAESPSALEVRLGEPEREDQWTCACAINSLVVAPRMKEISCSRERVRPSPFCRASNATSLSINGLTADTNYTVCVRYLCQGDNASAVACHGAKTAAVHRDPVADGHPSRRRTRSRRHGQVQQDLVRLQVTTAIHAVQGEVSAGTPELGTVYNATVFRTQAAAPLPPQNLSLVGAAGQTWMALQWSPPPESREFEVYVKAFTKLPDGTEVASTPVRIEVKTAIGAPSKIQSLHVVSRSKSSIVVGWSAPIKANGPLDGYLVYWCNRSNGSPGNLASLEAVTNHSECHTLQPGRDTRANVSPLVPESTYVIAVSAFNLQADRHNRFDGSPETITVETLPEAPPALRDLDVRMVSPDSVEVNWEAPARGVVGYLVAWCQNQRCSEKIVTPTRLIIHNLHVDSDYNVSVVPFRTDSQGNKVSGPLTTKLVTVTDNIDTALADRYLVGTIVCSVIIAGLGLIVFVFCRKKKGT
ncbi:hypothetical protein HPB48_019360 [Haemaphysalis longicornis]|uniref:Fibronectin type-III domain-containing protein n=1 Tax=Haemaphysalis longicornis TaxID=44386 RepID=A0A9J6G4M3_HAELO|nr:hypothetical protein HPB48_019360 [Haemaphysalis longicornis]